MFSVSKQSFNYKKQDLIQKGVAIRSFQLKKLQRHGYLQKTACKVNTLQAVYFMITDGKNWIYNRFCVFFEATNANVRHLTPFILSQFDVMSVIVFCKLAKRNIHDVCKIN